MQQGKERGGTLQRMIKGSFVELHGDKDASIKSEGRKPKYAENG
jgi:hypothetical protein